MTSKQLFIACALILSTKAYYLPEFKAHCYWHGNHNGTCHETIQVYVNRLVSPENLISYDYNAFDFCPAREMNESTNYWNDFGQILFGDRTYASSYQFYFRGNEGCKKLCTRSYEGKKLEFLKYGIRFSYENQWIIDNMPVTWCYKTVPDGEFCSVAFPMGCYVDKNGNRRDACIMDAVFKDPDTFYLFNHVKIMIYYHPGGNLGKGARIVKVTIEFRSHKEECRGAPMAITKDMKKIDVTYTYDVIFIQNFDIEWASRWDYILNNLSASNIRWFAIMNSLIIVLFLSGMVAVIKIKSLHKVKTRFNETGSASAKQWTLLRHDVFRPPKAVNLFCALTGVGVQIALMMFGILILASLGLLSPAHNGSLPTAFVAFFILSSLLSGFTSVRLYQGFGGKSWKTNAILTSLFISTFVFIIYFSVNIVKWKAGGSAATPDSLFKVVVIWLGFSVPLTILGGYICCLQKMKALQVVGFSDTPRRIPKQPLRSRSLPAIIFGGILPFGSIFIELCFILNAIWTTGIYYAFGFLLITAIVLVMSCAGVSIILVYLQLMNEDYRWHWRAFLSSGSTAIYVFIYMIYYYVKQLQIEGVISAIIYLGYSLIIIIIIFLFCGTVGFFSSYWFITKLYRDLENDKDSIELYSISLKQSKEGPVAKDPCLEVLNSCRNAGVNTNVINQLESENTSPKSDLI